MEKFDVVGRSSRCSQSTDKQPHLSHSLLITIWEGENRTTILIFGGIGTKEAISLQVPSARPVATR